MKLLQESLLFTMKNILDWLFMPNQKEVHVKRKVEDAEKEFYKYYAIPFKAEKALRRAIESVSGYQILDVFEYKKYLRHDLMFLDRLPDLHKNITSQQAYAMFFYMNGSKILPETNTSYIFPFILDNRNIIYFIYDENQIKYIYTLGSVNIYDFTQPIIFIRIDKDFDKTIFDK